MTRSLYVYAVLDRAPRARGLRGIAREPVRFVKSGRLVVAVGEVAAAPRPDVRSLRGHDRVVRRLAASGRAALPVRFGSLAPSAHALRAALAPRAASLRRALARVGGREQMTLRFEPSAAAAPEPGGGGPGTRHLRRLAGRDPRARPDVARLLAQLALFVHDERSEPPRDAGDGGRVHHLIDRGQARRYRALLRRAATAEPGVRVTCTGPWPPYGFASEELA